MGIYINPEVGGYSIFASSKIFIDKSSLIALLNERLNENHNYLCVTMPSRFGKTYIASMLASYYSKGADSSEIFKNSAISREIKYREHLNHHNVIKIDIAHLCVSKNDTDLSRLVCKYVLPELRLAYPSVAIPMDASFDEALVLIYKETKERFIFIIDEWDYLLRNYPDNQRMFDDYIGFLRSLFKSELTKPCFELVYMTGIMPIKRYGSMSALNDFEECSMVSPKSMGPFFGFSQEEVKTVIAQSKTKLSLETLKDWYDGYMFQSVGEVYCPNSVVNACRNDACADYSADTIAIEAITMGLKNHYISLEKESGILLSGGKVRVNPSNFSGDLSNIDSSDKGLTALIHAGFLSYDPLSESVHIPNKEMMLRFASAVESLRFAGLSEALFDSVDIVNATLQENTNAIEKAFDKYHQEFVSLYAKTDENVLSVLLQIIYVSARKRYIALKEPCLGLGRADAVFLPAEGVKSPAIIVELKVDDSSDSAIAQIKNKEYFKPLESYYGDILLVGVSFDKQSLKHNAKIERISKD